MPIHVVSQSDPHKIPVDIIVKAPGISFNMEYANFDILDGRSLPYDENVQGLTKTFQYAPRFAGAHVVEVKSHGAHVGKSPYQVIFVTIE